MATNIFNNLGGFLNSGQGFANPGNVLLSALQTQEDDPKKKKKTGYEAYKDKKTGKWRVYAHDHGKSIPGEEFDDENKAYQSAEFWNNEKSNGFDVMGAWSKDDGKSLEEKRAEFLKGYNQSMNPPEEDKQNQMLGYEGRAGQFEKFVEDSEKKKTTTPSKDMTVDGEQRPGPQTSPASYALGVLPDLVRTKTDGGSSMPTSIVDVDANETKSAPVRTPSNAFQEILAMVDQQNQQTKEDIEMQKRRQYAQSTVNSLGGILQNLFSAYGANVGAPIGQTQSTRSEDQAREDALFQMGLNQQAGADAQKLQLLLNEYNRAEDKELWLEQFKLQNQAREESAEADFGRWQDKFTIQKSAADEDYVRALGDQIKAENRAFGRWIIQNEIGQEDALERMDREVKIYEERRKQGIIDDKDMATFKQGLEEDFYKKFGRSTWWNPNTGSYQTRDQLEKPAIWYGTGKNAFPIMEGHYNEMEQYLLEQERFSVTTPSRLDPEFSDIVMEDLTTKSGREAAVKKFLPQLLKKFPMPSEDLGMSDDDYKNIKTGVRADPDYLNADQKGKVDMWTQILKEAKQYRPDLKDMSDDEIRAEAQRLADEDLKKQSNSGTPKKTP